MDNVRGKREFLSLVNELREEDLREFQNNCVEDGSIETANDCGYDCF